MFLFYFILYMKLFLSRKLTHFSSETASRFIAVFHNGFAAFNCSLLLKQEMTVTFPHFSAGNQFHIRAVSLGDVMVKTLL